MYLSHCCSSEPKTIVTEALNGFCGSCGQWVKFDKVGKEKEDIETHKSKVLDVLEFYSNPSNYVVDTSSDLSMVQMDNGQQSREVLELLK
jgi:hypothetical protein